MTKKLLVTYGWRTEQKPHLWAWHLHKTRDLEPKEDFRTGIYEWMTRMEAGAANNLLAKSGYQWIDAGEKPKRQL